MDFRNYLYSLLGRGSSWLTRLLAQLTRKWLKSVEEKATPLYHHNIEGMLADCRELRQKWKRKKLSEPEIFARTTLLGSQFLWGIVHLTWQRFCRALSLFFWGIDEQWVLADDLGVVPFKRNDLRFLVRLLHRITGNVGSHSKKIRLTLDINTLITSWSEEAEVILGFKAADIIGKAAVGTFVPLIETGQRDMTAHLREVCSSPEQFRLNVNENCDANGQRLWVLWVNTPIHDADGNCIGVSSVGVRTYDQDLMKHFVQSWNDFQSSDR